MNKISTLRHQEETIPSSHSPGKALTRKTILQIDLRRFLDTLCTLILLITNKFIFPFPLLILVYTCVDTLSNSILPSTGLDTPAVWSIIPALPRKAVPSPISVQRIITVFVKIATPVIIRALRPGSGDLRTRPLGPGSVSRNI